MCFKAYYGNYVGHSDSNLPSKLTHNRWPNKKAEEILNVPKANKFNNFNGITCSETHLKINRVTIRIPEIWRQETLWRSVFQCPSKAKHLSLVFKLRLKTELFDDSTHFQFQHWNTGQKWHTHKNNYFRLYLVICTFWIKTIIKQQL